MLWEFYKAVLAEAPPLRNINIVRLHCHIGIEQMYYLNVHLKVLSLCITRLLSWKGNFILIWFKPSRIVAGQNITPQVTCNLLRRHSNVWVWQYKHRTTAWTSYVSANLRKPIRNLKFWRRPIPASYIQHIRTQYWGREQCTVIKYIFCSRSKSICVSQWGRNENAGTKNCSNPRTHVVVTQDNLVLSGPKIYWRGHVQEKIGKTLWLTWDVIICFVTNYKFCLHMFSQELYSPRWLNRVKLLLFLLGLLNHMTYMKGLQIYM